MNFTQAICYSCWTERNNQRIPIRLREEERQLQEICCYCGNATYSGIYIGVDPRTVKYPSEEV